MSTADSGVVRREGSKEVRVLFGVVFVLLIGAYLSWTKKEQKATAEKVVMADIKADDLTGLGLMTKTQTVSVEKKTAERRDYWWFSIETGTRKRGFVGGEASKELLESFGPLMAQRKLGSSFTPEQLEEMKLAGRGEGKLILKLRNGERSYDLGGRTFGARDWYVRPTGGKDVYLVPSKTIADLEFPEGRFMQRQLRKLALKDVSAVTIKAGGQEKRLLHQNRLSEKDAFWADADAADAPNETFGNYVDKLNALAAIAYVEQDALKDATPVLQVTWFEDDKPKESTQLFRVADGDKTKYLAVSDATLLPVEVTRSTAEQLEQDLAVVLAK